MKILCIGEALIDMICTDRGVDLQEGINFEKKTGGAPANVAAAIAALGGKVDLAAKVGNDPFGKKLIHQMENFNVGTSYMTMAKNHFTTMAFVSLKSDGERDFVFSRGADGEYSIEDLKAIDLSNYNIVHFGSATAFLDGKLRDAYYKLLEMAIEKNIFISFDPNYRQLLFGNNKDVFKFHAWYYIERCHFFKVSGEEALLLTGAEDIYHVMEEFKQKTNAIFAITIGKEGTLLRYEKDILNIPSIAVNPIDTTGAGDAFVGAVLYQIQERFKNETKTIDKNDWHDIITKANVAGARTCEYLGAMEAFKKLSNKIFQE